MPDDEKPNPIARQSDLDLLRRDERYEHLKTRALVVLLAAPSVVKSLPFILGMFGWHI